MRPLFEIAANESWPDPRYAIRLGELHLDLGDNAAAANALDEARHRLDHWGDDPRFAARIEELERRLE